MHTSENFSKKFLKEILIIVASACSWKTLSCLRRRSSSGSTTLFLLLALSSSRWQGFKLIFVHSHVALFRLERSASSSVARIWQLAQRKESCLQDWSACRRWFSLEVEMRKLLPRMARQRRIWRMGRGGASLSSNSMPASSLSLALWTTSVRGMILR